MMASNATLDAILVYYGLDPGNHFPEPFGSGLIHSTYIVRREGKPSHILQQINHQVFKHPEDIAHNLRVIGSFLQAHHPEYLFTAPLPDLSGNDYLQIDGNYYRLFRFVEGTHSLDACTDPSQAYEASRQFGRFTSVLNGLRTDMLRYTIPGFHDLGHRYRQFADALKNGNEDRIVSTKGFRDSLSTYKYIVDRFEEISRTTAFRKRVTHHDTKISNVLFDGSGKGVCVIDLDTVMPGYFISDVGDMMRTYLSPATEEEVDMEKIVIRKDFFSAIVQGYRDEMDEQLGEEERGAFVYAGKFMVYMQALRFYTDYLNNDIYYGSRYEGHNLNRARNQLKLLQELDSLERELSRIV